MRRSERLKGGLSDLAGLVIVASLILAAVFIVSALFQVGVVKGLYDATLGRTITVKIFIQHIDEGNKINSFQVLDKGSGSYADILALQTARGSSADLSGVRNTLRVLGLSLVVTEGERIIVSHGTVREGEGKYVDFALPGLKKGRLGIDKGVSSPQT